MPSSASLLPTAVVTGVSKGIGLAVAVALAADGYAILGCASTAASVDALRLSHPDYQVMQADLSQKAEVERFAAWVLERCPAPDVLVNNAGKYIPGQLHSEPDDTFEQMLAVNLHSAYYLTKRLVPSMIARQTGTVVNICSTASITAYPNGGSYCIAKFGLLGFGKVLREELKPQGVRVTNVLPGATRTASWDGTDLPDSRFMAAQDVAEVVRMAVRLPAGTVLEDIVMRPQLGDLG